MVDRSAESNTDGSHRMESEFVQAFLDLFFYSVRAVCFIYHEPISLKDLSFLIPDN
jgi:hypothetical protein